MWAHSQAPLEQLNYSAVAAPSCLPALLLVVVSDLQRIVPIWYTCQFSSCSMVQHAKLALVCAASPQSVTATSTHGACHDHTGLRPYHCLGADK